MFSRRYLMAFLCVLPISLGASKGSAAPSLKSPVIAIRELLAAPDSLLDYGKATAAIEKQIDAASQPLATWAVVNRLVDAARQMAGPNPTDSYKLSAIRKAIYVAGPWNYNRAFSYDLSDPFGKIQANRLISTYIRTRKGNCVSMPILFLIIADRMGLNVHLAAAPLHLFVRYTDPQGVEHNLETTSGGHEARTEWMRSQLPMSDKAIASGIYMRTLSKRESIAEMATIVMDYLFDQQRFGETIDAADAILAVNPREAYVMVRKASAYSALIQVEFSSKYATPAMIPAPLRTRYKFLETQAEKAIADAKTIGWEPAE